MLIHHRVMTALFVICVLGLSAIAARAQCHLCPALAQYAGAYTRVVPTCTGRVAEVLILWDTSTATLLTIGECEPATAITLSGTWTINQQNTDACLVVTLCKKNGRGINNPEVLVFKPTDQQLVGVQFDCRVYGQSLVFQCCR